jgi:cytochrome c5
MKTKMTGTGLMLPAIACTWLMIASTPLHAADGEAVYNKSCKMCHASGMMSAPKVGDADAWKALAAKGRDVLYDHSINGFHDKGMMPPRGGDDSLTDEEVKAAVDYMVQNSK